VGSGISYKMSYMEIYNEEINDLLAPNIEKLQIHENLEGYLFFGLKEEIVATPEQIIESRVKIEDDNVGASCDVVRVSVVGTCPISRTTSRRAFCNLPLVEMQTLAIICNITLADSC
ncbi:hypothetical protein IFM89_027800, partial [Coptis chinensis]